MRYEVVDHVQKEGQMIEAVASERSRSEEFLDEVRREVTDPVHTRLIQAYRGDDPVKLMESELARILLEVLRGED